MNDSFVTRTIERENFYIERKAGKVGKTVSLFLGTVIEIISEFQNWMKQQKVKNTWLRKSVEQENK